MWQASVQICENKRKRLHKKEFNSHRIVLEHQYGLGDVMWKRSIACVGKGKGDSGRARFRFQIPFSFPFE